LYEFVNNAQCIYRGDSIKELKLSKRFENSFSTAFGDQMCNLANSIITKSFYRSYIVEYFYKLYTLAG